MRYGRSKMYARRALYKKKKEAAKPKKEPRRHYEIKPIKGEKNGGKRVVLLKKSVREGWDGGYCNVASWLTWPLPPLTATVLPDRGRFSQAAHAQAPQASQAASLHHPRHCAHPPCWQAQGQTSCLPEAAALRTAAGHRCPSPLHCPPATHPSSSPSLPPSPGPFRVSGVPMRRVCQAYVIATQTKLDISSVKIPATIDDAYFCRPPAKKGKKSGGIFAESAKVRGCGR